MVIKLRWEISFMGWLDVCMQAKDQFYCTIDIAVKSFDMVEKKLGQIRTEMDVCLFKKSITDLSVDHVL